MDCGLRMRSAGDHVEDFIRRYLDACLKVDRSADVISAVDAWASGGPPQLALALSALERGLADPRDGWRFRRRCYEWSVNHRLPEPHAQVVIAACVDVIAPNHPQQAIVRLHHIARRRDDVAQSAQSALLRLADDRRVLLASWPGWSTPSARISTNRATAPVPGRGRTHPAPHHEQWRAAAARRGGVRKASWTAGRSLRRGSKAEYEHDVRRWLEVCTAQRVANLLDILVAACRTEFATSATLSSVAFRWLEETSGGPDTEVRRHTVRGLDRAIDDARTTTAPHDERTQEGRR